MACLFFSLYQTMFTRSQLGSAENGAELSEAAQAADTALVQILRAQITGETAEAPAPMMLAERALYHGVAGLLADNARQMQRWPDAQRALLQQQAVAQAMWELQHKAVLRGLLADIAAAGIRPILLKGTALAYGIYANPAMRSRSDSDILVPTSALGCVRAVLERAGFERARPAAGQLQESWTLTFETSGSHDIDLHWAALNAPALASIFSYEQALISAQNLPALCPQAWGLSADLALLHACAHRARHGGYGEGNRLIWLYDIALLCPMVSAGFTQLAAKAGLSAVCRLALHDAHSLLGAVPPAGLTEALASAPDGAASYYLLQAGAAGQAWRDFTATKGVQARRGFIWHRLWPGAAALRDKYPQMPKSPVAVLFLRRIGERALAGIGGKR
ncbi:MAG: nucleotidyltransferase family protein [Rhodobacteraceae bacterium]|nr:nucleotidyltransferase family protein [Paracoccaceae bacterium]